MVREHGLGKALGAEDERGGSAGRAEEEWRVGVRSGGIEAFGGCCGAEGRRTAGEVQERECSVGEESLRKVVHGLGGRRGVQKLGRRGRE